MGKPSILQIAEDRSIPEPNTGCWLWLGAVQPGGYGFIHEPRGGRGAAAVRKQFRLSRMVCEAMHGHMPAGHVARHTCDQPYCVNPAHIIPGTVAQNAEDCVRRGRHTRLVGERNPAARLTAEVVADIRARKGTETGPSLAARHGVKLNYIYQLWIGRRWRHV